MENNYTLFEVQKQIDVKGAVSIIDAWRGENFSFDGESHDFWEMVCVADGNAGITADDRLYTLSAGDTVFHKPMEFHKIRSLGGQKLHIYILSFAAYGEGMKMFEKKTLSLNRENMSVLEGLIRTGGNAFELNEGGIICGVKNKNTAQEYFNRLELFLLGLGRQASLPSRNDADSRLFASIISVLENNLCGTVTLDGVAKECCISLSKLKKLFKCCTGIGLIEYFTRMKMNKAAELLSDGKSVKDTSDALGFSNQFYFSRVFSKQFGMPPSKYCKNQL